MAGILHPENPYGITIGQTDFAEDLETIDVPTLILHGDDDQNPITTESFLNFSFIANILGTANASKIAELSFRHS
jgi:pimeloyl-ACP methyl ester carboxylesterase